MTKPKRFLDSLREMVSPSAEKTCAVCHATHAGDLCPSCGNASGNGSPSADKTGTQSAYLVDLVSNHKIQIPIPLCKVGRDECNDIVISGDQAISRQHLSILKEGDQFFVEDAKSRHGSFINGTQLKTREPINDGDVIKIGVSLFWFVAERAGDGEENGAQESSGNGQALASRPATVSGEPQHVSVKSEFFLEPTDPSTSTAAEIPVLTNEEVLLDRLRLKTRSFEKSDMFIQAQLQPGALRSPTAVDTGIPASSTQSFLPALDGVLAGTTSPVANNLSLAVESFESSESGVATKMPETRANVVNQITPTAPVSVELAPAQMAHHTPIARPALESAPAHIAQTPVARAPVESAPSLAPQNQQSLNHYLSQLASEHNQLTAHIEQAEKRRQEIAGTIASANELINSLIGGRENVLVTASQKVLSQLGWHCDVTGEGGQDLHLTAGNQSLIAHIMWTAEKPDRTHLGKLFIAQTRFWCDKGVEPKGILIISLLGGDNNAAKSRFVLNQDAKIELANFVKNKNVCLLTTANLLSIYHAIALNHLDSSTVREKIMRTDGWLEGFDMEPLNTNI